MKKIIASLAFTALLFGCGFGSGSDESVSREMEEIQSAEIVLDDNLFVALSAEILCLPSNHPEATAEEIEIFAKNILENAEVDEETFSIYQLTIEADAASKKELSLAILGKMGEFCTIIEGGGEEAVDAGEGTNQADAIVNCKEVSCPDNYVCYHSQYQGMGANGLVLGEEEGDLRCHLRCENDSDCEKDETCQDVELLGGDVAILQRFCLSEN